MQNKVNLSMFKKGQLIYVKKASGETEILEVLSNSKKEVKLFNEIDRKYYFYKPDGTPIREFSTINGELELFDDDTIHSVKIA